MLSQPAERKNSSWNLVSTPSATVTMPRLWAMRMTPRRTVAARELGSKSPRNRISSFSTSRGISFSICKDE